MDCQDLIISFQLNELAQDWAEELMRRSRGGHRPNNEWGENIFYSYTSKSEPELNGKEVILGILSQLLLTFVIRNF